MKTYLIKIKAFISEILAPMAKRWKEYVPFVVAFIVWGVMGPFLRIFWPTAGVDDAGLVQALIFGLVLYFAACAFSWFALRIVFPGIGKFVDDLLTDMLAVTDEKTRIWASIAVFAVYFFGAIIILASSV
jgi:hypothetical protein